MTGKQKYCTVCGTVDHAARFTKGSFLIELLLWLCFLVPGLLYSLWRVTSRYDGCAKCGAAAIVPVDSPIAKKALG